MPGETEGSYKGWYIALALIAGVFAVMFTFWFIYHPL
jgi:hypothetical protein